VTQGNAFGRKGGRWMPESKLRALFRAGLTYDEIAAVNERAEGWKPSRAAVKRKYEALGEPPRHIRHTDLLPWKMRQEHDTDLMRHMLGAESRSRNLKPGETLSDTDRKLVSLLHEKLFGRGKLMVVGYHPDVGFYLTERKDSDDDIIRRPARYADQAEQAIWDRTDLSEDERYKLIARRRSERVAESA
jgi:hypothetical protein